MPIPLAQQALLPMGKGVFIMPLNASLRKAIHKNKGAMLKLRLEEDKTPLKVSVNCWNALQILQKLKKNSGHCPTPIKCITANGSSLPKRSRQRQNESD